MSSVSATAFAPPRVEQPNKKQTKTSRIQGLLIVEPIPFHPVYLFVSALVYSCITTVTVVRLPSTLPLSPLLAFAAAWCIQLLSASPLRHLAMKQSAASTTHRIHVPLFSPSLGDKSAPNGLKKLPVEPSVTWKTLRSPTRYWAEVFSGGPGPGFSPPVVVPSITRRFSRSLVVRCTTPAKRRRHLCMVVSTLSNSAFLRALAYDMRWSVRCRRRKPMIRRTSLWCAVRGSAKCS